MLRFRLNRLVYGSILAAFRKAESGLVRRSGLVQEARVAGAGTLPFCVTHDEHGMRRGGQPAWMYLRELTVSSCGAKIFVNRQLLAQLPPDVSFHFVFSPALADAELVKAAFRGAGFQLREVETYLCRPRGPDLVAALTGHSIKGTLRRAKRDLEVFDLAVDEFFAFHEKNLRAAGKASYRDSVSDRLMLAECVTSGHARVFGARRKPGASSRGPSPLDAAVACLWDEADGAYKLWRTTHREADKHDMSPRPHPDASKLLILVAMEDALAKKLVLDTDGSTPGLEHFYSLFGPGVFQRTTRLQFELETLWSMVHRYYPSAMGKADIPPGAFDHRHH